VAHGRSALDHPVSLFEHAQRLLAATPEGPLPSDVGPVPACGVSPRLPHRERKAALAALLREYIGTPALTSYDLHERCDSLALNSRDVRQVLQEAAPEFSWRLGETARWLVRNGTDRSAVLVGLGLLSGHAVHHDVPLIKTIGLLRFADHLAIEALAQVPDAAVDLMWLADRSRGHARITAVRALAGDCDPQVRDWVLSTPRDLLSSDLARQLAELCQLSQMLEAPAVSDKEWDQAGNLLLAMSSTLNYHYEINRYEQARTVYSRWIARADERPATLERAALLTMAGQDISTGPAAAVMSQQDRGHHVRAIRDLLASAPWQEMLADSAASRNPIAARRARWVVEAAARQDEPDRRFAIRVVVPDPEPAGYPQVEARILLDGVPIVASAFDKGPAAEPEYLLAAGRLRATSEPREVRLAEAYCTEGCCGGLYVTIAREGAEVVWSNWRTSMPGDPPREVRFDAEDYDQELARAESDHGWEWPARTVARLVNQQLRAEPDILARWDCAPGWCTAWLRDFNTARVTFLHPAHRASFNDPHVQCGLVIDLADESPETVTARLIESMRASDPKTIAEVIGGSKDGIEKLGLTPGRSSRW
jgi:hypothetical protein